MRDNKADEVIFVKTSGWTLGCSWRRNFSRGKETCMEIWSLLSLLLAESFSLPPDSSTSERKSDGASNVDIPSFRTYVVSVSVSVYWDCPNLTRFLSAIHGSLNEVLPALREVYSHLGTLQLWERLSTTHTFCQIHYLRRHSKKRHRASHLEDSCYPHDVTVTQITYTDPCAGSPMRRFLVHTAAFLGAQDRCRDSSRLHPRSIQESIGH